MPQLFLLIAVMVFTMIVMLGMIFVFKDWFKERDKLLPRD